MSMCTSSAVYFSDFDLESNIMKYGIALNPVGEGWIATIENEKGKIAGGGITPRDAVKKVLVILLV